LGYRVVAAPRAIVYHAFSGRVPGGEESGLAAGKLHRVTYGRLRFITRLLDDRSLRRFRRRYRLEDWIGSSLGRFSGRAVEAAAYRHGWRDYHRDLPRILEVRRRLQERRLLTDAELFAPQRRVPQPLIRRGLPLLTWDAVCRHYGPWQMGAGRSHFPETARLPAEAAAYIRHTHSLKRGFAIWRAEGLTGLAHHLGRAAQWRLQTDL
jgi:hypothetical protein